MAGRERTTRIDRILEGLDKAGRLDDAVPAAELPAESETPEQHFAQDVEELLHQAFDAFGLDTDGIVTRVKRNPDGSETEHLVVERRGPRGRLVVAGRQPGRSISLSNLQYEKPEASATYYGTTETLDGLEAIVAVHKALIEIIPLTQAKSPGR